MLTNGAITANDQVTVTKVIRSGTGRTAEPRLISGVPRAERGQRVTPHLAAVSVGKSTTGINPWWTFNEGVIPGVGKYLVNVANGNLLVQSDDVNVAERGIDLAFRRTYNMQSTHDALNSDGSVAAIYGDHWTNTFDAHMAYNSRQNILSVYDIDGARYDYTSSKSGLWVQTAGVHETLRTDGGCGYYWEKKSGTIYYFFSPPGGTCSGGIGDAYRGRIYQIFGRNHNNYVGFSYSWIRNDSSSIQNLLSISAAHSDGHSLLLTFGIVGGHVQLATITRPDGSVVNYKYDTSGVLLAEVDKPGDGLVTPTTPTPNLLPETYSYSKDILGDYLDSIVGPRFVLSSLSAPGNPTEGGVLYLVVQADARAIRSVNDIGIVNFAPYDRYNTLLQPTLPTGNQLWRSKTYSGENINAPSQSALTDSDGHSEWTSDSQGRVTQHSSYTGTRWLTSGVSWDAENNQLTDVDARGNATYFAYDAHGNTIAMAEPATNGYSPTSLYSYDSFDNILAYCDPVQTHAMSADWPAGGKGAPPAANTCKPQRGTPSSPTNVVMQYSHQNVAEPNGELVSAATATGYKKVYAYDATSQGGIEAGLPTSVVGDAIAQADGTTRTNVQSYIYDFRGNVICYGTGNGVWTAAFDGLNRVIAQADPDDASLGGCPSKTPSIGGSSIVTRTTYTPDGHVTRRQTPEEASGNYGSSYLYDADGNETSEYHVYGCTASFCQAGLTQKWYDGADRLVEVALPVDPSDYYQFSWQTRYIYDLSGGGTNTFAGGAPYRAYGNLFKTEELLLGRTGAWKETAPQATGVPTFVDTKGAAYDAIDRTLSRFKYDLASKSVISHGTNYDENGQLGLMSADCNEVGQCSSLAYDARNLLSSKALTAPAGLAKSADEAFSYDADKRVNALAQAGVGTWTRGYDLDGRLTYSAEPGSSSPAQRNLDTRSLPSTATWRFRAATNVVRATISGVVGRKTSRGARRAAIQRQASSQSITAPPPTSAALTSPTVIRYAYYQSGERQSLSVQSTALSGNPLIAYSYRPDGKLQTEAVTAPGASFTTSRTYLASGRPSQQSESGAATIKQLPTVYSYDGYGRVSRIDYPYGEITVSQYEAEGNPTNGSSTIYGVSGFSSYTVRDEALDPFWTALTGTAYINGLAYNPRGGGATTCKTAETDFDAVQSVTTSTVGASSGFPYCQNPATTDFAFDAASRATYYAYNAAGSGDLTLQGDYNRTFDNEDHTISQIGVTLPTPSGNCQNYDLQYAWGPWGHPMQMGGSVTGHSGLKPCYVKPPAPSLETLHWDGDTLLYTTNSSGVMDDLKIDSSADYTPGNAQYAGVTFWQRGADGSLNGCATTAGDGFVISRAQYRGYLGGCQTASYTQLGPLVATGDRSPFGQGSILFQPGADGYSDGYNVFQGLRAYDSELGSFTTPDAYAGDVHDPMSQKPFVWNRNNPVEFSDPSGYDPYIIVNPSAAMGFGHMSIAIVDHNTGSGTLYSQHPPHGEFSAREIIDRVPVTAKQISEMASTREVATETTSAAQDHAMLKRANQLFDKLWAVCLNALEVYAAPLPNWLQLRPGQAAFLGPKGLLPVCSSIKAWRDYSVHLSSPYCLRYAPGTIVHMMSWRREILASGDTRKRLFVKIKSSAGWSGYVQAVFLEPVIPPGTKVYSVGSDCDESFNEERCMGEVVRQSHTSSGPNIQVRMRNNRYAHLYYTTLRLLAGRPLIFDPDVAGFLMTRRPVSSQ